MAGPRTGGDLMPITPDTKNWTWVLERPCPDCGFDAAATDPRDVAGMIRDDAEQWLEVLSDDHVDRRPDDATWSALEYGCHVRDVYRRFDERLGLMLEHDDPLFANWDQDVTAVEERYAEQDPGTVGRELREAALVLADRFDSVAGEQWQRTGRRSDGASFTVESFSRYLIHDPVHHQRDVAQGFDTIAKTT